MSGHLSNPVRVGRWHGSKSRRAWFRRVMEMHGFKRMVPIASKPRVLREEWHAYCHWCKRLLGKREITLDHIVPVSKGGLTSVENLVPACFDCNQERSK